MLLKDIVVDLVLVLGFRLKTLVSLFGLGSGDASCRHPLRVLVVVLGVRLVLVSCFSFDLLCKWVSLPYYIVRVVVYSVVLLLYI